MLNAVVHRGRIVVLERGVQAGAVRQKSLGDLLERLLRLASNADSISVAVAIPQKWSHEIILGDAVGTWPCREFDVLLELRLEEHI